jgi:hypothetical protein
MKEQTTQPPKAASTGGADQKGGADKKSGGGKSSQGKSGAGK